MDHSKITPELKITIHGKLIVIFILFSFCIMITGAFYYFSQQKRILTDYQTNLTAIASLKINQINQWNIECLEDANVILNNEPLINKIKEYYVDGNNEEMKRELIRGWNLFIQDTIMTAYHYSDTFTVFDHSLCFWILDLGTKSKTLPEPT